MNEREPDDMEMMEIAGAVFHGHVLAKDTSGQYSGFGHANEKFTQALTAQPYGIRSYAPANTGLVLTRSKAGLLVLSQTGNLPSGVSEPLSGETLLYNSTGQKVHLDANGDVLIGTGTPVEYAARADRSDKENDTIQGAFDAHVHTETGGTTSVPTALIGAMNSVACDEVKIT